MAKNRSKLSDDAIYIYNAPYPGVVPGLPLELTGKQAKELGRESLLLDAIANGTYLERRVVKQDENEGLEG